MRKITLWLVSTVAAVVLLFSYRTSTSGAISGTAAAAAGAPGIVAGADPGATAGAGPDPTATPGAGPSTAAGTKTVVVNGSVAQTRWGPVQVQVRIAGSKITEVKAIQVPSENRRDDEINSYAVPQLRAEALAAQSAHIDTVSGATVTSDGYVESLQAALDAAHFKG
jgi:uncharacterized protein with FMN-binding domain